MARKPAATGRERREREAAKKIADKYIADPNAHFEHDRDDDEGDEALRRAHIDEGFEEGAPKVSAGRSPHSPPPPKADRLTLKQSTFATEYLVDGNGTQAAIRAGYSAKTAAQVAYENLRKPEIRAIIDRELNERAARARWTADMVLIRLGQEVTADIADLFDDKGNLLPVRQWPLVFRTGLVAGIDLEETTNVDAAGALVPGVVRKIKLADRHKKIEALGRHVSVMAFKERQLVPEDEPPLARLLREMQGTSIRPTTIEGTAVARPRAQGPSEPAEAATEASEPAPTPASVPKPIAASRKISGFGSLRPREAT